MSATAAAAEPRSAPEDEAPLAQPPASAAAPAPESGFASAETMALPRIFGRLLLLKLVARGGMGDVYLAATTGIEGAERPCVVKTVRRDHIHDGSFLARFLDEARVQAQLNHPGVAQVLEASTDENGEPYTVVEYVEGRSLSDVRARSVQLGVRIGWAESVAIAIEMANALGHVHERAGSDGTPLGIVHRDLSPQNVMIGYVGEVKLIDFGTARGQNRKCHTVAGVVFAKPGYVAPEVARQQVGDGRIDLYALGIMLWEMCAGRRFLNGDPQKHLEEAAAGKVKVPAIAEQAGAPPELDEVIQRLVANEPDDRYASGAFAAGDLSRVLGLAPPGENGERSVRGRIQALMRALWPHEPARSRSDFAKHLKSARALCVRETQTPASSRVMEIAAQHMNDDPSVLSGTPYRLISKIGEGASGVVWAGEHVELGRKLAIKVLLPGHASASDAIDRFRREARAVARLSHPNLVQLYDFGRSVDGRVFLAMELLQGATVDMLIKDNGMDWREGVHLAIDACKALEAAHAAGLVHRDLKPANLFLTDAGVVKLLDFGVAMALADVAGSEERRQQGFAIFGTPEYMAPEQVAGEAVDARCDLYALGCLLYELLTGSCPFEGPSSVVVMGKQLRETAEAPRTRAPKRGIPTELDAVVMRLLAKEPGDRFPTATSVRLALEETLLAPKKHRARVRGAATAIMACVMALGIGAGVISYRAKHAPARAVAMTAPLSEPARVDTAPVSPEPPATGTSAIEELAVATEGANGSTATATATPTATPTATATATPTATPTAKATPAPTALAATTPTPTPDAHPRLQPVDRTGRADLNELADARVFATEHPNDKHALKNWATAASHAGAMREARRAGEAWALKDESTEPRLFLASVLDATGHRGDARAVLEQWISVHPDSADAKKLEAHLAQTGTRAERVVHKTIER